MVLHVRDLATSRGCGYVWVNLIANHVQYIAHVYQCAVIMPDGGSIWELYHDYYLGYKPNQDIKYNIQ